MLQVIENSILKKYYRQYFRNIYRRINHSKNLSLDLSSKLIILVYHRVLPAVAYDPSDMIISFKKFVAQVSELSKKYPIISLNEAVKQINEKVSHQDIQIILTFDDGYRDSYEIVFPYLCKKNIPATLFLSTDYIEKGNGCLSKDNFITWEQAREMNQKGMEMGSHGLSHHSLTQMAYARAVAEIRESKALIEQNLGRQCHHFAFPFGSKNDFSNLLIEEVKKAGYQTCLLNIHGYNRLNSDSFCFRRIIMNEDVPIKYLLG